MNFNLSYLGSPLGDLLLVTDDQCAIRALDFADHQSHLHRGLREQYGQYKFAETPAPQEISDSLSGYFAGDFQALDRLVVVTQGTELQERVWQALRQIPTGSTTSYGKLAKSLGFNDPRAAIEIGAANGANSVAIIVPCHRVIASDGSLKNYAWGVQRKRWLLKHEQVIPTQQPVQQTLPGW